jgi:DNA-binding MarR family transcriptional regulator
MLPPTLRQRQAEKFIEQYVREHDGVPPNLREIAEALNCAIPTASNVIKGLVKRGRAVKGPPWVTRSIRLIKEGVDAA